MGDEGEDPRAPEVVRRGSGQADQGEGGGDREGGEVLHGRGGQAPEVVPEAPGGQGSDRYGGEGVWPRAHEVREGGCRQGGALSVKTVRESEVALDQSPSRHRCFVQRRWDVSLRTTKRRAFEYHLSTS